MATKQEVLAVLGDVQNLMVTIELYAKAMRNGSAMDAVKEIEFQTLELTDAIENFGGE